MKKFLRVALAVLSVAALTACGSAKSDAAYDSYASTEAMYVTNSKAAAPEAGYYDEEYYEESDSGSGSADYEDNTVYNDTARKLIKTYNVSAETEDFDNFVSATEERVNALHGYIQDMDSYNGSNYSGKKDRRYCNLTIRVPVKNLDAFVNFVGDSANVTNKRLSVEDITLQYVDSESRKKTYEIQRDRLNELLEKADSTADITTILDSLSEVEYRLERQTSQLRTYDNLVDYATVYLYINEVTKYTPPEPEKYWDRVKRSFSNGIENLVEGLKDFFVGFVGALPGLVLFAVIVAIIVIVIRAIVKAGSKKREAKREKRAEELMNQAKETAKKNAENRQ
ncbi:MAG: DUF4349 domain-containing protein [Lachnospiraceae bacterium]|nr:DUF4349 domain-containing protein [Lachnospiraceae bacterium]